MNQDPSPSTMKLLFLIALLLSQVQATTFVDDDGTTHTIPENPTIVTGAMDAVAFYHFGMSANTIVATIGERSASGSNYGGQYFDGNLVYSELGHEDTVYDPKTFPADPSEDERAFLDSIAGDLSSECSSSNYYCDLVDVTYLNENGWPDVFVVGSYYSTLISDEVKGNITDQNVPLIILSEENDSIIRNMIEMTERMEELASALGVDVENSIVRNDKAALCSAAESFQETAKQAHEAGVRAMATYMPYQENEPGTTSAFLPNPYRDPVLLMMQNMGLPILYNEHSGNYWEYQAGDFTAGGGEFKAEGTASVSGVPYNVDFWLYDDRVSLDFLSKKFSEEWPHPALTAKQYAYWPSNARILSYRHAAEILTIVGGQLEGAERVSPASDCVEPVSDSEVRDLAAGEYSCLKVFPFDFCVESDSSPGASRLLAMSPVFVLFFVGTWVIMP